jgi:lipoyl(octanoyl) transferase
MLRGAHLVNLGVVDYREALTLQESVASGVADGTLPDTVLLLEHPPTITLGRRSEEGEVHLPDGAEVEIVEVNRGGKSTYHAPGQLVCYPIFDLTRHGQDVKRYCRDLEEALIRTIASFEIDATRIEGLTGVWLDSPPRKIASIGIHLTKWISTHGYALNVDLDPAPFTDWITACGLDGYQFTSMARELGRPVAVDDVRPAAAQALADVFGLAFEELPAASSLV